MRTCRFLSRKYSNSTALSALATAGLALGISTNACADTIDFTDNGTFTTTSLTEGNVTVTGSNDVQAVSNSGLGIVGGVSSTVIDPGETMTFEFANPVTSVVIGDYQPFDTDDNGLFLDATLEGIEGNGAVTVIVTQFDGSSPINVSNILGVSELASVSLTMNFDSIRVRSILFPGSRWSACPVLRRI